MNSSLPASLSVLLQELSIHRVELEMQNEELRDLQSNAEASMDKFKKLFDLSPTGYVETDMNGRITEVNSTFCKLVNYERPSILQLPFIFFISSGDKRKYLKHLNKVISNKDKDSCELRLFRRKGILQNVLLQSVYVNDMGNKCCLTTVIELPEKTSNEITEEGASDISGNYIEQNNTGLKDTATSTSTEKDLTKSKLMKTLKKLEETNKELEEFTSIISHDLQEPVRIMENMSHLLLQRYKGKLDPQGEELTQIIADGAVRMKELIKELLNLSKITTKGKPFEWINTEGILQLLLADILNYQVNKTNAIITNDPMPEIFADRVQFEHLLQNLITNAIKYHKTDVRPEVHISCISSKEEWIFSVKDNGIGIDPQHHERIFRIFQRLHLQSEYEGSGVGLALCKKIVDRHRGRIWVESEEGKGSTFYFTIPRDN
ncbi:MAG: ATP-binding protein [Clostridiales bacterium]